MKEFAVEKLQELENNREFAAKMETAKTMQDVLAVVKEYGIEVAEERNMENGELSEELLDTVSGGGWLWDWFKSWFDKQSKKNTEDINKILKKL